MAKVKVQITLDGELLERVDSYADENYINRSALVTLALNQFLTSQEIPKALRDLSLAMRKIADTGEVDGETMQSLSDFERLANILVGK